MIRRKDLVTLLKGNNVPLKSWGSQKDHMIDALRQEIKKGLCVVSTEGGTVVRSFRVLQVDVFYGKPGPERLRLRPTSDGGVTNDVSTFEVKIPYRTDSEHHLMEFVRHFLGNIGILDEARILPTKYAQQHLKQSKLYPGVQNRKFLHRCMVHTSDSVYIADGYKIGNVSYVWRSVAASTASAPRALVTA